MTQWTIKLYKKLIKGAASDIVHLFEKSVRIQPESSSHLEFGDTRYTNIVVDSAFQTRRRTGIKKELISRVINEQVFPTRAFYMTEDGAMLWIDLTKDISYGFYRHSVVLLKDNSTELANEINKYIDTPYPDIISLGSGDGAKDYIIISKLVEETKSDVQEGCLTYYPIDYSYDLIIEAIGTMSRQMRPGTYKIKAIVGDMHELRSFKYVYDAAQNRNVFFLLGNTIGNNDEKEIVHALNASLDAGDMALIEVNTDQTSNVNDHIKSTKNMEHNAVVLSMLGITADYTRFEWPVRQGLSLCPGTLTVETIYRVEKDDRNHLSNLSVDHHRIPSTIKRIHISFNHRYNFNSFCEWISNTLSCTIVWKKERDQVGLVLLGRPPQNKAITKTETT